VKGEVARSCFNEGLITAISVAGFFFILGLAIALTPGISANTTTFIKDLTNVTYPATSNVNLFAPAHPSEQIGFFTAVTYFLLGMGILQLIILPLRLWNKSSTRRIASSLGGVIFWLGSAVAAYVFLLKGTLDGWFSFWAVLLVLIGVSLIARFIIYFASKPLPK
jgi:hypothetical protein